MVSVGLAAGARPGHPPARELRSFPRDWETSPPVEAEGPSLGMETGFTHSGI